VNGAALIVVDRADRRGSLEERRELWRLICADIEKRHGPKYPPVVSYYSLAAIGMRSQLYTLARNQEREHAEYLQRGASR
jgi:hypothetical protein